MIREKPKDLPAISIKLDDIYYALFRRKWLILGFFVMGLLAAASLVLTSRPVYRSTASLMIRYVSESKSMEEVSEGTRVRSPDYSGRNIMNSELEILTSFDLAADVVTAIGADKILGNSGAPVNPAIAAVVVSKGLRIEVPRLSNVIKISFAHSQPEIAQQVLRELINSYKKRHLMIHREIGIHNDFLTKQRDRFKGEVATAEAQIENLRFQAGGVSPEDSRRTFANEISRIRQELLTAELDLAQQLRFQEENKKDRADTTNSVPSTSTSEPAPIESYKNVVGRLSALRAREIDYQLRFSETNSILQGLRQQIADAEALKSQLEQENPSLATWTLPTAPGTAQAAGAPMGIQNMANLTLRTNVLNAQLKKLEGEVVVLDKLDAQIQDWQRKKALAETNLWSYSSALEQAQIADAMGPGKISSIPNVQEPSPAFRDPSTLIKRVAAAVALGLFGGLGLALLLELVLNRTLRQPHEVESRLGVPMFLSLPDFLTNGQRRLLKRTKKKPAPVANSATDLVPAETSPLAVVTNAMRPYCEALRDRLVMYFQSRNMTHKPKLVAITSCARAAGVTTIATGLAAALSETGDGNVLLVDMNLPHGAAGHPFSKGKPGCGLVEALEGGSKGLAQVQDNLFLVSGNGGESKEIAIMPQRFTHLVPKLKASDFDYIIFDMPPITQTSPTVGLAPFFDIILTVVESEKTQRGLAQRAVSLLQNPKSNLVTIMNRKRSYLPQWLHQEL